MALLPAVANQEHDLRNRQKIMSSLVFDEDLRRSRSSMRPTSEAILERLRPDLRARAGTSTPARCSSSSTSASSSAAPVSAAAWRSRTRAFRGLSRPVAALLKLRQPADFAAADGMPVDLVIGLLSPENSGATHLHALAAISRLMRDDARPRGAERSTRRSGALQPAEQCHGPRRRLNPGGDGREQWRGGSLPRARGALRLGAGQPAVRFAARSARRRPRADPLRRSTSASTTRPARRMARSTSRCSTMPRSMRGELAGHRPLPADHRVQPALHQAGACGDGDRRGPLDQRAAARVRRRSAPDRCRGRGDRPRHRHVHALAYRAVGPARLSRGGLRRWSSAAPAHLEVSGPDPRGRRRRRFRHRGRQEANAMPVRCWSSAARGDREAAAYERMPQPDGTRAWTLSRRQDPENPQEFWDYCDRRKAPGRRSLDRGTGYRGCRTVHRFVGNPQLT